MEIYTKVPLLEQQKFHRTNLRKGITVVALTILAVAISPLWLLLITGLYGANLLLGVIVTVITAVILLGVFFIAVRQTWQLIDLTEEAHRNDFCNYLVHTVGFKRPIAEAIYRGEKVVDTKGTTAKPVQLVTFNLRRVVVCEITQDNQPEPSVWTRYRSGAGIPASVSGRMFHPESRELLKLRDLFRN